ncbi:katanin p80 WD40 repeat-containing subunit B1 homolog KTN80.4-like isoform X1 [Nymphaea colorata]|nr:katanin p80 WD40 repeat-containing subunit B1 homolog KTN80.4-like isoform X1 [Nymphaea colorata]
MKRGYKLQEFVAHSSNVNCLKIGKKSSRVVVTGGEDQKVNLWAIGKPNSILSLSGHTSPVESVTFDSSEVFVVAGASSGTIKLWDLEEAKIVRTLTGHRSNCISVDFHPFGEFFASGSLDTNLKIWDIRRKGCIHTYKGHSRGVNYIKFTPDGRWVVSGGEDNVVKLWDLTAGKLLHDFKCHEGQIQCMDFHPHEFLLATGSSDRTVKFWDLETFELIGSAGPEASGIRSMVFNPDGRTLFCGLHESLKVFSWEPVRCHDIVDMGWSKLADLNIHDGKLLGCSFNQSCVGVWVADISRIAPYAVGGLSKNGHPETKSNIKESQSVQKLENSVKANIKSFSPLLNPEPKEAKVYIPSIFAETPPRTPPRFGLSNDSKTLASNSAAASHASALKKRTVPKVPSAATTHVLSEPEVVPVVVPRNGQKFEQQADSKVVPRPDLPAIVARNSQKLEQPADSKAENATVERPVFASKPSHARRQSIGKGGSDIEPTSTNCESSKRKNNELNHEPLKNFFPGLDAKSDGSGCGEQNGTSIRNVAEKFERSFSVGHKPSIRSENCDVKVPNRRRASTVGYLEERRHSSGRTRTLVDSWERRERSPNNDTQTMSSSSDSVSELAASIPVSKSQLPAVECGLPSVSNEDECDSAMQGHHVFLREMQFRLTKLQVVRRSLGANNIKGAINTMEKMNDHSVEADAISVFLEKFDFITLDTCASLLPLLTGLLSSKIDRHISVSLEMLLKLVRTFGPVIHSTVSARTVVGVDLHAEERLERCNQCFAELQKVKQSLSSLLRKGGLLSKAACELNLALEEV